MSKRKKHKDQEKEASLWEESDETFAYIAGYTSGGVSYGVTWEEWDELYDEGYPEGNVHHKDTNRLAIADKDLPF